MRFRQRMNVDLPQPEGPMMAVTSFSAIGKLMPLMTSDLPKLACSPVGPHLGRDLADADFVQRGRLATSGVGACAASISGSLACS